MMTDDYKIQVSIKHGPQMAAMTNVRAGDSAELENLLAVLISRGPDINDALKALAGVETVAQVMPGTTVVSTAVNAPSGTVDRSQQVCPHGAMTFRETADYAGHFCSLQKTDPNRCKPRYLPKGR